ncbi:MAG: hydantoinase/oxoprolinase family protein [Burkholderiales bacterium]|nr:hydantoinase/oxoprolinase family protein [Burkholderiales bacterium]
MPTLAGIDVGGTFTDLVLWDPESGDIRVAKVPTTVPNQAVGVLEALEEADTDLTRLEVIIHGTTTTTNALLERKIARVGLITTQGFRDVLELGRRTRPTPYGLTGTFAPLIPRELRLEVPERISAEGEVLMPLDEDAVRTAVRRLLAADCESLVIHFLHSYREPKHELRAVAIARELWPNGYITAGHAILAEYREYERGVAAAVNASVQPVLQRYLRRLRLGLTDGGFGRELLVMQGNGGTVAAQIAHEHAVSSVMSGPASGVIAAAATGRAAGIPRLITYDMGGTSTDVALVEGGLPRLSSELELEYAMPIHVPMVDVHSIGAGGGSIARIDDAGMLQVGPESAGARPGPICYGRGGTEPTITDANLVLGRLDGEKLLAVDAAVTVDEVRSIILERIGKPLGLDIDGAAAAIIRIANDRMAGAIRMVSLARGHDPRDFALFAFGGAGPLHACALARELGIPRVLIPARPGLTNALGCAVADLRHDYVRTVNVTLADLPDTLVRTVLEAQMKEGRAMIAREGVTVERIDCVFEADMQFLGQSHLLSIPIDRPEITRDELRAAFEAAYWQRFQVRLPEIRPVLVNLHTAVIGRRNPLSFEALGRGAPATSLEKACVARRPVWFDGGRVDTPVYRREWLPEGANFQGPAIIEQLDTTIVVEPGNRVTRDALGNLLVQVT